MKKFYFLICIISLLILGCSLPLAVRSPFGGVSPAGIMTEVGYPSEWGSSGVKHSITGKYNYKIIGPVEVTVESTNIFGLVAQGDNGYKKLLEKVRSMGGDNVINVVVDTKFSYYVFGIYQKVASTIYGLAIKYIPDGQPVVSEPQKSSMPLLLPLNPSVLQPAVREKPDKTKNYSLSISGQKYGPVNYQQIQDLKRMGYLNDNSPVYEINSNKEFKVGDFEEK